MRRGGRSGERGGGGVNEGVLREERMIWETAIGNPLGEHLGRCGGGGKGGRGRRGRKGGRGREDKYMIHREKMFTVISKIYVKHEPKKSIEGNDNAQRIGKRGKC